MVDYIKLGVGSVQRQKYENIFDMFSWSIHIQNERIGSQL
jgi:hypothetical protein